VPRRRDRWKGAFLRRISEGWHPCLHFEKIYGLALDADLSDDDLFAKAAPQKVRTFLDGSLSQRLLFALMRHGANDVSSWDSDTELPFPDEFLEIPRQRLEVAGEIVWQIRGSQNVKISVTLHIDCFRTVVNEPSFKSRDWLYLVGFVIRKNVEALFPTTAAGMFRCEIQSVVVCDPDGNETVELTPHDCPSTVCRCHRDREHLRDREALRLQADC
jgi:hypothetical protein